MATAAAPTCRRPTVRDVINPQRDIDLLVGLLAGASYGFALCGHSPDHGGHAAAFAGAAGGRRRPVGEHANEWGEVS
jgi:hypothetical protein